MIYRQQRPAAPLDAYIDSFWYCQDHRAHHRRERVFPNGSFQLVIELSDGYIRQWDRSPGSTSFYDDSPSLIVGMQSQYSVIDTSGLKSMAGVVFRPGCARYFFDLPAHEFFNRDTPLDQVWGSAAGLLRSELQQAITPDEKFRVLTKILGDRLNQSFALHSALRYAMHEFQNAPHCRNVLDVARDVGLSRRRFAQLFREQVGLTPKLYCRVLRFQQVIKQIRRGQEVNWAQLSFACGYCDQAHLANEFRQFSGISPGTYSSREHLWRNHAPID